MFVGLQQAAIGASVDLPTLLTQLRRSQKLRFQELRDDQPFGETYTFRINPNKLSVEEGVVESYELSKAGWDYERWHSDLIRLSYAGQTGAMLPADGALLGVDGSRPLYDIRQTEAWQKFERFKEWRRRVQGVVAIDFFVFPYVMVGSINKFKYDYTAERPAIIDYNFSFTAVPLRYEPVAVGVQP